MKRYQVPEMAQKIVQYDMIQNNTELPEFPDARIRLLFTFLEKSPAVKRHTELLALATALVQMGMDTHDLIDTSNDKQSEREMRSKQLKVLAGDYFSSQFYQLLSQAGLVDMVQSLSMAICEVNRLKMNLYIRMKQLLLTAEDYLTQKVQLKMELFTTFNSLIDEVYLKYWPDLLKAFTECEVVRSEIVDHDDANSFIGSWGYWHILHQGSEEDKSLIHGATLDTRTVKSILLKYNIRNLLMDKLRQTVAQIQTMMREPFSERMIRELTHIGEPFARLIRQPMPVVKEG